jgi:hypothetical protein
MSSNFEIRVLIIYTKKPATRLPIAAPTELNIISYVY